MPSNIMVSSPKLGDRKDWAQRINLSKGIRGIVGSAIAGKGPMPPKGLCVECSEKAIEAAIFNMIKGE